jgi:hypothetical protein
MMTLVARANQELESQLRWQLDLQTNLVINRLGASVQYYTPVLIQLGLALKYRFISGGEEQPVQGASVGAANK